MRKYFFETISFLRDIQQSFSLLSPDKSNKSKEIQISKERSQENPL